MASASTEEASGRKLHAEGSNSEAPKKKVGKTSEDVDDTPPGAKLLQKMDGVESKIDNINTNVKDAMKIATETKDAVKLVDKKVDLFQNEINTIKREMEASKSHIESWKDHLESTAGNKINEIEAEIKMMNMSSADPMTVVFGGLKGASALEEAETWVNKVFKDAGLPPIMNPYIKSDKFEDLMFARLPSAKMVNAAVGMFRRKAQTFKDDVVWCNIDQPFQDRLPLKVLLQFKRVLARWGFQKRSIRIDEDTSVMKVADKEVIKVSTKEGKLDVEWLCDVWKDWDDLHKSTEFNDIVTKCREDLALASQKQSKGFGKGKPQQE